MRGGHDGAELAGDGARRLADQVAGLVRSRSPPEGMTTPIAPTASPYESKTGLARELSPITASSCSTAMPLDRTCVQLVAKRRRAR